MPLTKGQKEELVAQLVAKIKDAKAVVFADYQGLTVDDIDKLRKDLREAGATFQVAKRTLIKLAAKEAGFDDIPDDVLEGPVGAAFSMEDEISAAKIVFKFGKKNENLKIRGGLFEGKVLSTAEAKQLAQLPSREELVSKFIYLVKYPIQGFHGALSNTISGFVRALNAIKEKQEKAA